MKIKRFEYYICSLMVLFLTFSLLIQAEYARAVSNSEAAQPPCDHITIADMSWNSASFAAHLDQFILEHAFDCSSELIPGDTMATGTSMIEKGKPDIAPELWTNSLKAALDRGLEEERIAVANQFLKEGGIEGLWIPRYMLKIDPALATIEGVKKHAKLFKHPEEPGRSAVMNCPAGWSCQISISNLFKALALEEHGFELVDPGSSAGLTSSLAKAYLREAPWIGYYWVPTAAVARFDLVLVDFGSGVDEQHFYDCIAQPECDNPQVSMFPNTDVLTIVSKTIVESQTDIMGYLQKRSFNNDVLSNLLAWTEENQASAEEAMIYFLKERETLWTQWLTPPQVEKIKMALKNY